jgi:chromosome partitioning protein
MKEINLMPIISIINEKGGVGKTTLATHIARGLQKRGMDVLLIDSDPQGSLRDWYAAAGEDSDLPPVIAIDRPALFKDINKFVKPWTIIDGAPSVEELAVSAIKASDFVIIPVQPSPYDVWATESLVEMIQVRQDLAEKPKTAFLISRQISGTKLSSDVRQALEEYGFDIFKNHTTQRVLYPTTASTGTTVLDVDPEGPAAQEINLIVEELIEWVS